MTLVLGAGIIHYRKERRSSDNTDNEGNDHEYVNEATQNDDAPALHEREKGEEGGVGESKVEDSANETTGTDDDPPLSERETVEESGDDNDDDDEAKYEDSANGSSSNNDDDIATGENSADDSVNKEGAKDVELMASQTISVEGGDANHDVLLMSDDDNGYHKH
eukprot:scaffold153047_cov38-Attheya_sp.AAC.1